MQQNPLCPIREENVFLMSVKKDIPFQHRRKNNENHREDSKCHFSLEKGGYQGKRMNTNQNFMELTGTKGLESICVPFHRNNRSHASNLY